MSEFLLANEPAIRLAVFAGFLAAMALWEALAPRRPLRQPRRRRWPANIGIVILNTALVRVLFPTAVVGIAAWAGAEGLGLFNTVAVPQWFALAASVVVLDLVIYGQHVVFHYVPWLWRLHRVHHIDADFDVTTGVRFHPLEILLSVIVKFAAVIALGAPPAAVILFELILSATSLFTHGNVRMGEAADRAIRALFVTPDMHRVHHSVIREETDSNFGFALSTWDRLFGTYRAQPQAGHGAMSIGVTGFADPKEATLAGLFTNPFR